jgi:glycosyltransferase involved in cell wall biosynthesis
MKVLLVGPFPPPHGGVSVHVAALRAELRESGVECRVVDLDPRSAPRPGCITIRGGRDLLRAVFDHARRGYAVHLHTNGHNRKSWLIALVCALAGRLAPASLVTFHSGMLPAYVARLSPVERAIARLTCRLFTWTICVNREIESALERLGAPRARLQLLPAFLPPRVKSGTLAPAIESWIGRHSPLLSTTLFFRSEYGFDMLMEAVARLRREHPHLGCVAAGSGPAEEAAALVRRRGLYGSILLAGDLDHDECLKLMARSDVFVRPTRTDGDSISVREAAALGIPTVASDVGHRPEGLHLFPRGDIEGLVRALRAALVPRQRVWRNGRTDTLKRLLELYGPDEGSRTPDFLDGVGGMATRARGTFAYARIDAFQ